MAKDMEMPSNSSQLPTSLACFTGWLGNFQISKSKDVQEHIIKLVYKASLICGLRIDDLLEGVDFDSNNLTIQKLEAIISELRSIVFLDELGFKDICPVARCSKKRMPDLWGNYKEEKFVIEVVCLTSAHSRKKVDGIDVYILDNDKFLNTLRSKAKEKKLQIDADGPAQRRLLIFVINRSPEQELYSNEDYRVLLTQLSDTLDWGNEYFFAVITNSPGLIYPNLP